MRRIQKKGIALILMFFSTQTQPELSIAGTPAFETMSSVWILNGIPESTPNSSDYHYGLNGAL